MADKDPLVVGFDLDMTLADTRIGIGRVYDRLSAETGVFIDSKLVVGRLGPPLEVELANWFPPAQVPGMVSRYRELYEEYAVPGTTPMPGPSAAGWSPGSSPTRGPAEVDTLFTVLW